MMFPERLTVGTDVGNDAADGSPYDTRLRAHRQAALYAFEMHEDEQDEQCGHRGQDIHAHTHSHA